MTSLGLSLLFLNVAFAASPRAVPYEVRPMPTLGVQHRIHGGMSAREGQFPFMIFALMNLKILGISKCSSSLISPDWVLMAAHCLENPNLRPEDVLLVGGKADLWDYVKERILTSNFYAPVDENKLGVQERRARGIYLNPRYSQATIEHDVGLVKLRTPFRLGPVQTIPISSGKIRQAKECMVLGWGLTLGNADFHSLNFVQNKTVTTPEIGCRFKSTGPFVCLLPAGGGICQGDSGSPLVCDGKVWGVASHYVTLTESSDCGNSDEEYYSELHPELRWVEEMTGVAGVDGAALAARSWGTVVLCLLVVLLSKL